MHKVERDYWLYRKRADAEMGASSELIICEESEQECGESVQRWVERIRTWQEREREDKARADNSRKERKFAQQGLKGAEETYEVFRQWRRAAEQKVAFVKETYDGINAPSSDPRPQTATPAEANDY